MIEQKVNHPPLKGFRGVALIAVIALVVILLSNLFSALEPVLGSMLASLLFILCGMGVAGVLLNRYVLGFMYTCDGSCLRVSRIYGKRFRPMAELWLNSFVACGTLEEMQKRFPGARCQRAVKRECMLEPLAVAYRNGGRTELFLLQPDEALKAALLKAVKK